MTVDNMNKDGGDGSLYTNLFSNTGSNYQWLASRCVYLSSSCVFFSMSYVERNTINANQLYQSYDNTKLYGNTLRPVVTIDLNSVKLEGEGTEQNPYTIVKR